MLRCSRLIPATVAAALAVCLVCSVALAEGGASFGLRPAHYDPARPVTQSYFVFDATPGQTIHDEVLVRNSGTTAGTMRLYAVDAVTGDTSGAVYLTDGYPRKDVGAWIALDQHALTLGPGDEHLVPFTLTIPADARPGQHLGGLVAEDTRLKQENSGGAVQINVQTRAVTAVQVDLPGAVSEKVTISGIQPGGERGRQTLLLAMRNDGTDMVKPTGTLTVTNGNGQVVQDLSLHLDTFVPQTGIAYPAYFQHQALGPGRYHAAVHLTYGKSGVTAYQGDFVITPDDVAQVFKETAPLAAPVSPTGWFAGRSGVLLLGLGGGSLLVIGLAGAIAYRRRHQAR